MSTSSWPVQQLSTLDLSYNCLDAQATLGPASPLCRLPAWVHQPLACQYARDTGVSGPSSGLSFFLYRRGFPWRPPPSTEATLRSL